MTKEYFVKRGHCVFYRIFIGVHCVFHMWHQKVYLLRYILLSIVTGDCNTMLSVSCSVPFDVQLADC